MTDSATLTRLIAEFRAREALGRAKYGTTVDRTDLSLVDWLEHQKQELMDALLYTQRALDRAREAVWRAIVTAEPDAPANDLAKAKESTGES